MAQGLEIYDASGNFVMATSHFLGRILGVTILTGGTNGSLTDAGFGTGAFPFWGCYPFAYAPTFMPDISVSGNTLSWSFPSGGDWSGKYYMLFYGII